MPWPYAEPSAAARDSPRVAGADHVVGPDDLGAPMVVFRADADHEVGTEPLGDLLAEERVERAPADALHDFAHEVAELSAVVLAARAGLPPGRRSGECCRYRLPVEALVSRNGDRRPRAPGLVAENHPHGDVALAGLGELRPVGGDRFVHVQQTAIDESVSARGRHPLGRRERAGDRVALPLARPVGDRPAAPQIDDLAPVDVRRHSRAQLALLEAALERLVHRLEPRLDCAVDGGVAHQVPLLAVDASLQWAPRAGTGRRVGTASGRSPDAASVPARIVTSRRP